MSSLHSFHPSWVLRFIGMWMLATSLIWMFSGFMVYIMIKATNIQSEVNTARLGVAVSVCVILFLAFTILGMGVMSGARWAWRHTRAASLTWLLLGVYLLGAWLYVSPYVNQDISQHVDLSEGTLILGQRVVASFLFVVSIIFPAIVIAVLSLRKIKDYVYREPPPQLVRPLNEMVMLWGIWGIAVMMVLGLMFDDRLMQWTQGSLVEMRYFWLWSSLIVSVAGFFVYTRQMILLVITEIMALFTLLISVAAWLATEAELQNFIVTLPQDNIHQDIALSAFLYFSTVGAIGTGLLLFQKWQRHNPI